MPSPGVKARIERFWASIKRLEELSSTSLEEFLRNPDKIDAAERNVQVGIQALVDVGEFLISKAGMRVPRSHADVGNVLLESGIISVEERDSFVELVKFRNILVHNYVYVAAEELYRRLPKIKESLSALMRKVLQHMEERGIDP